MAGRSFLAALVLALVALATPAGIAIARRRGRAKVALRASEERFRVLCDSTPLGIFECDAGGACTYANPALEGLTGRLLASLRGFGWVDVIHPEERDAILESWVAAAASGRPWGQEHRLVTATREVRWVRTLAAPVRARDGAVMGYVGTVEDVTEHRKADEAIRDLLQHVSEDVDRLKAAEQALRTADAAKDRFLANVSHDLRSPLGAIQMWTKLLRAQAHDPRAVHAAAAGIDRATLTQYLLVQDLLDVSRIVAGKMTLDVAPVDMRAVVRAAHDAVHEDAQARGLRIVVDESTEVPTIHGDPARLQQVVWNLLANAVKFSHPGGSITVGLRVNALDLVLSVRDEGVGIEPDLLPHVFEPFRQAEPRPAAGRGGLGLGLAIVQQVIVLHGGRVVAESPGRDRGATFTVRLPLAGVPTHAVSPRKEPALDS